MSEELDGLWAGVAHIAHQRVETVARAVEALRTGAPDRSELCALAFDECHKLVGSLDSFGRAGGSALALQTAEVLQQEPPDVELLDVLVRRLRQVVTDPR